MKQWIRNFFVSIAIDALRAVNWQKTKPCWLCHAEISEDAHFCEHCGIEQSEATQQQYKITNTDTIYMGDMRPFLRYIHEQRKVPFGCARSKVW